MSIFHDYSLNNQLLISVQMPQATRVAGFNTWKKVGRFVKKGEKGIRIMAPMVRGRKNEPENEEPTEEGTEATVFGFRVVSVFDISQTDGKPLPDIGGIQGKPGQLLPRFRELIRSKNITLEYERLNGPKGISKGGAIVVDTALDPANEFSVLAHELVTSSPKLEPM